MRRGEWYEKYFDCDPERFSEKLDPMMEQWLEKEAQFFETIGVDQRITVLGQDPDFRCGKENIGGWYYSLPDLERFGVLNIEVLGDSWSPVPPTDRVKFCRVDLSALPD